MTRQADCTIPSFSLSRRTGIPLLALLATVPGLAMAQAPTAAGPGNPERGRELAVECAACHGPDGNSPSPLFPRLAGQHEEYLVIAMQSYLDGRRTDPIMKAAILTVKPTDLKDLATWFASQKPAAGTGSGAGTDGAAVAAAGTTVGPAATVSDTTPVAATAPTEGCPAGFGQPAGKNLDRLRDRDRDGVPDVDDAAPRDPNEFARDTDGDGAFEICTIGQLQAIRTMGEGPGARTRLSLTDRLARHYEIVADLDAAGIDNFAPIGDCGPEQSCMKAGDQYGFAGTVEGHGHVVRNLRIERPEAGGVGLFGVLRKTGVIRNLGVENSWIRAGNGAGSLVGANFGTVSNGWASGDVSARAAVGVLVGGSAGTVIRGRARGQVSGEAALGGVIGDMRGVITDSWADVSIKGTKGVGGLVGLNTFGRVINSYALGKVEAADNVGGLVGMNTDGVVENSYASGDVTSTGTNAGGLVGFNSQSRIRGSYATGAVTAKAAGGTLVGRNNGEIRQSFATGSLNGADNGDLVGEGQQGTVVP
jgi:cytochrome c553